MAVQCGDIINLPSLKQLRLVAGMDGLDQNIHWVYAAEILEDTMQVSEWLNGGELLFITGVGFKGHSGNLAGLIQSVATKNIAGLVVFIGPYIGSIDPVARELADKLRIPLFELPWEVKLVEVTHEICSAIIMKEMEERSLQNLMETLLFSQFEAVEGFLRTAARYGYRLEGAHRVVILDLDDFQIYLDQNRIQHENEIIEIKNKFQKLVKRQLNKNNLKALSLLKSDSVIILFPGPVTEAYLVQWVADIRRTVAVHLQGLTLSAGIGESYSDLKMLQKSLNEAEQALRIAKLDRAKNTTRFYHQLGAYQLLLHFENRQELEGFFRSNLGELVQYDRRNGSELILTLEVLVAERGNQATAASKLQIHRNTLAYRLQKIEQILGVKLDSADDFFNLQLGLKIRKILEL
jgi:DNA-binding PucR family transcriptional regulator